MIVEIRYDDECGNGHNSFAITADLYDRKDRIPGESHVTLSDKSVRYLGSCGCMHEGIEKHFPELKKYIKWHLTGSDGPMHYIPNTVYLAGNRDCYGRKKGEPCSYEQRIRFGEFPITFKMDKAFIAFLETQNDFKSVKIIPIEHKKDSYSFGPKYTFSGYECEWYKCPFDTETEAKEFLTALQDYKMEIEKIATDFSKGKDRELDAARNSAVWLDATDKELSVEPLILKKKLIKRLHALMVEFKKDVEELGFVY
jgi:hypothetical protein